MMQNLKPGRLRAIAVLACTSAWLVNLGYLLTIPASSMPVMVLGRDIQEMSSDALFVERVICVIGALLAIAGLVFRRAWELCVAVSASMFLLPWLPWQALAEVGLLARYNLAWDVAAKYQQTGIFFLREVLLPLVFLVVLVFALVNGVARLRALGVART